MTRPTRRASRLLAGIGVAVLAGALSLAVAAPAYAATFTVSDTDPTAAFGLNTAIASGDGTIKIDPGLVIDMSAFSNQAVTNSVTVVGDAANPPTIIGPLASPIFQVTSAIASIEVDNVVMKGSTSVASGDAITTVGGTGSVTLVGDTIENFPHAGVEILPATGNLTVTDSILSGNASGTGTGGAIQAGGGIGDVTITRSTFDSNSATGHGGAIYLAASHSFNISGSTFTANSVIGDGAAIEAGSPSTDSTWRGTRSQETLRGRPPPSVVPPS